MYDAVKIQGRKQPTLTTRAIICSPRRASFSARAAKSLMNGQLSQHPLGELINEVSEKAISGTLRITCDRVKAAIYFQDGRLIFATSNIRLHRLTEYFRKHQIISAEIAKAHDSLTDFEFAAAAVSQGLIDATNLNRVRAEQVTDVLRVLLLAADGIWSFDGRARLTEPVDISLDIRQLLLEAA